MREAGAASQQVVVCEEVGWGSADALLALIGSQVSLVIGGTKGSRTTMGHLHLVATWR